MTTPNLVLHPSYVATFETPLADVVSAWADLATAVSGKAAAVDDYGTAHSEWSDAVDAWESAESAWITEGSLGSGDEYNAKVSAAGTLATKDTAHNDAITALEANAGARLTALCAIENAAMSEFELQMSLQTMEPEGQYAKIGRAVRGALRVILAKSL